MKWEKVKIGDICDVTSSKRIFFSEYVEKGIPFFRSKEIIELSQGNEISECLYITEDRYNEIKKNFGVPALGDMLLTSVGTIGVSYIIKNDNKFYFKDGNLTWFRKFSSKYLSKFLMYYLTSVEGKGILNNMAIGSSQKALTIATIKSIEVPCPPIEEQERIVSILSAYDDLIENNKKQIKLLEEAAQRLYKEWFVDLRFPGHENVPVVDGVPEGWEKKEFSEIFTYSRGKSYSSKEILSEGQTLLVNLKNISPFGGYKRGEEKFFVGDYKTTHKLSSGDLIMGVTDMTQERRLVGHVAIVPEMKANAIFSMDLIKIQPKELPLGFLYSAFRYGGYSKKVSVIANGVNVLHLKPEAMMSMEMLIPDGTIVKMYESIFEMFHSKIEALNKQLELAVESRDLILPKLMSGEIEV